MWEQIASNKVRSWIFVSLMGILLVAVGLAVGMAVAPGRGAAIGALAASGLWLILWIVAIARGDAVILSQAGATKISKQNAPQLWNVVEEMTIASGLGRPPDVYIIDDPGPNAFAIGRKPEKQAAVAVTSGLLRVLDRDELQGVVGHEIGHLKNRDTAFMILAGVMLGAIILIADLCWRMVRGMGRSRGRKGSGHIVFILIALAVAILAPILARMLYFACSRRREYLADASSALFTRYPEGLASALQKISAHYRHPVEANRVLAPMYIVNPMHALAAIGLFSTHPPTENRIRILRSMGGADYTAYEKAFHAVTGRKRACIGARTLAAAAPVQARGPSAEPPKRQDAVARSRDVIDMVGRLNNMILMTCACGVGIRIPPAYRRDAVSCPRCGQSNRVPAAAAAPSAPEVLRYRRVGKGWESFKCPCGAAIQLSPSFSAPSTTCGKCGRKIEIAA